MERRGTVYELHLPTTPSLSSTQLGSGSPGMDEVGPNSQGAPGVLRWASLSIISGIST